MSLVTASHISNWANTNRRECQGLLPELVRRLIRATTAKIREINLPVGDAVSDEGWDGVLDCDSRHPMASGGISGWEIGTDKSAPGKAQSDYEKRKGDSLGLVPKDTTFVFVTPRAWPGRRKWADDRRKEKHWKDVRVIAAGDLQTWLDDAPVVDQWLARQTGITPASGLRELEFWWQEWAGATKPALIPSLLLAGRSAEADLVSEWVRQDTQKLYVQADAPDEALAFLYATLSTRDALEVLPKVVVADTEDAFRTATSWTIPHLIASSSDVAAHLVGAAQQKGHKVFIATSRNVGAFRERPLRLGRLAAQEFESALVESGYEDAEARKIAWECGRSIPVLRRQKIARNPRWAEAGEGERLIPALFCGGWSEHERANPFPKESDVTPLKDQETVGRFAEGGFNSVSVAVRHWAGQDDPPLRRVDTDWKLTAPVDAWFLLAKFVERKHLDQLQRTISDVFLAIDPKFDLPESQWFSAGMFGKLPSYSGWLQEGLAQTLAIVANYGEQLNLCIGNGAAYVDGLLRQLFAKLETWQAWASIDELLPSLAEAAPNAFLMGVERFVSRHEHEAVKLLAGVKDTFSSGCLHAGLLWAIERVAWSPRHLGQSCTLLARLNEIDPGGAWANRPSASLQDILVWPDEPYTYANAAERLEVLDNLVANFPYTAWQLLTAAVNGFMTRTVRHPPHIGEAKPESWTQDTPVDVQTYCRGILDHLFTMAGAAPVGRMIDLIKLAHLLGPVEQDRLAELLIDSSKGVQDDDRARLSKSLDKFLERTEAGYTPKAPRTKLLKAVEQTFKALQNTSIPAQIDLWFSETIPRIPGLNFDKWDELNKAIAERQQELVVALLAQSNTIEVLKHANALSRRWDFGFALAACTSEAQDEELCSPSISWPCSDTERLSPVLMGYAARKYSIDGEAWLMRWLKRLSEEPGNERACTTLLTVLPRTRSAWERVTQYGPAVEELFWSCCHGHPEQGEPIDSVVYAVEKLCSVGRATVALQVISVRRNVRLPGEVLVRVATAYLSEIAQEGVSHFDTMGIHYVEQLFEAIDKSVEIAPDDKARLEWAYFPILRHSQKKPAELFARLASSPEMFVSLVSMNWRSPGQEQTPLGENEKALAEKAYWLLDQWDSPLPGQTETDLDQTVLRSWVDEARQRFRSANLEEIGDDRIGKLLSAAPLDPNDGLWPHSAVRDILEINSSNDLDNAFHIGKRNRRGVTTRSLRDGGAQERALAAEYQSASDRMHNRWPHTAYVLKQIGDGYLNDAKWHDDDVARRDL